MPRILVLDDEPLIALLVEGWLDELGCEVVGPAGTVEAGLELAESGGLDAAILDVKLGDGNSYAVARFLMERGVPFAFATGKGDLGDEPEFDNPLLLMKPFDFEGVKGVVQKLLGQPDAPSEAPRP